MRTLSGGWGAGAAIAIGILGTVLWTRRESNPVANPGGSITESSAVSHVPMRQLPSGEAPAADTARVKSRPPTPPASFSSNDSTYNRMLASAQVNPTELRAYLDITREHEAFMLSPDDPVWARATEQSLQGFFRNGYSGDNFTVTSVACRSTGCEVQTLSRRPAFNGLEVVPPASEEFGREMQTIFELTREPMPLGEGTLRLDNVVATPVDDQMGSMLWYRRVP